MPEEIEDYNPPTASSQPSAGPLKEFLKRKEIRTMRKDIARLREIEAQKEKERITTLKLEEIKKERQKAEVI